MRLVYMDEAGISSKQHEPFLIVAAVIVDADKQLVAVERHLDRIVESHIPAAYRAGFVLHATHIFNGGGPVFKRLKPNEFGPEEFSLERRLRLADAIAQTPKRQSLRITYGKVDRAKWPQSFNIEGMDDGDRVRGEHVTAFMLCELEVEHWMRAHAPDEVCLVIVENNNHSRDLIRSQQIFNQKRSFVGALEERAKAHLPLRKIKEDPLFQDKRPGSLLQLADFCAFVIKRVWMGDLRYRRFLDAFASQVYEWRPGP